MKYTTNDLSKILDVSTNTIRRFEGKGYLSAGRNEQNGYRTFTQADVEKLMYVAKYRKLGFSHEDIAEILQKDIEDIIEDFRHRKEDIDAQIYHLQALSHMLKDDMILMGQLEKYGTDVAEHVCSPVHYVLYQKKGKLCTSGKQAQALHRFMTECVEFEYLYLFEWEDIEAGKVIYSEGVCGHQLCTTKYHVNVDPPVETYERRPCLIKFIRVPLDLSEAVDADPRGMYQYLFGDFIRYMAEHNLKAVGDVLGIKVGYSHEEDKEWQYLLLHLPIE